MFGRRRGFPVFPARVRTEGIDTRKHLVDSAFVTLRAGLGNFAIQRSELIPDDPPELSEIDFCVPNRRYISDSAYESTQIYPAANGYALRKLTKGGLADSSIALKVPTDGSKPEFHSKAFNIDLQCFTPRPVDLTGIREISQNHDAVVEVLSFERDIVYGALTRWVNFGAPNNRYLKQ